MLITLYMFYHFYKNNVKKINVLLHLMIHLNPVHVQYEHVTIPVLKAVYNPAIYSFSGCHTG